MYTRKVPSQTARSHSGVTEGWVEEPDLCRSIIFSRPAMNLLCGRSRSGMGTMHISSRATVERERGRLSGNRSWSWAADISLLPCKGGSEVVACSWERTATVPDSAAICSCNLLGEKSATTALQSAATATPQCQTVQLQLKPAFHPTATVTSFQFDVEAVFKSIYRLCLKSIKVAFKSFLCFFCEDSQIVIVIEKRVCWGNSLPPLVGLACYYNGDPRQLCNKYLTLVTVHFSSKGHPPS